MCITAHSVDANGRPSTVEHRLTVVLTELIGPPSLPPPTPAVPGSQTLGETPPEWDKQTARTLIANYYPQLVGLPPHSYIQEAVADRVLGLPPKPPGESKTRHERVLQKVRGQAEKATGRPMSGKQGSGGFVQYLLNHRHLLEPELIELHAEYLDKHPTHVPTHSGAHRPEPGRR